MVIRLNAAGYHIKKKQFWDEFENGVSHTGSTIFNQSSSFKKERMRHDFDFKF